MKAATLKALGAVVAACADLAARLEEESSAAPTIAHAPDVEHVKDAARAIGISRQAVYQLIAAGVLEHERHGRRVLVVVKSREAYQRRARAASKPHRALRAVASG